MRLVILSLLLLALPCAALADDAWETYDSSAKGFSLSLPAGGVFKDEASDPDWDKTSSTVFTWEAPGEKTPLSFVTVNVVSFLDSASQGDVDDFMADELSEDNLGKVKAELVQTGEPINTGGHSWSNARFRYTDPGLDGEYEVFVTYNGQNLYAIYFEYSLDTTGGDATARDILATFITPASYT